MWPNNTYNENEYCKLQLKGRILSQKNVWDAVKKAIEGNEESIALLKESGLIGRGGAGFPLGLKWESVRNEDSDEKIVVCNASEGEPGTAANAILFQENPEAVLAGIAICCHLVRANKAYIYLRKKYMVFAEKLRKILLEKKEYFDGIEVVVFEEPGGYVCGEETALLETLEGSRGEPRLKPPYPTVSGAFGKPTVINNVESFANVPFIINNGVDEFKSIGTENAPGTKLYTISGPVVNPGVYELEIGLTLGELLKKAGGLKTGTLKGMQLGGASGIFVKEDSLDKIFAPKAEGVNFGVGDIRFITDQESIPQIAYELVGFFADESCGVCIPCKYGLLDVKDKLESLIDKDKQPEEYSSILNSCKYINQSARCAMGQAASGCLTSALSVFPDEFKNLIEGRNLF